MPLPSARVAAARNHRRILAPRRSARAATYSSCRRRALPLIRVKRLSSRLKPPPRLLRPPSHNSAVPPLPFPTRSPYLRLSTALTEHPTGFALSCSSRWYQLHRRPPPYPPAAAGHRRLAFIPWSSPHMQRSKERKLALSWVKKKIPKGEVSHISYSI